MLRDKIIDLNNFKTDIIANVIEEYQIDFEDTRYGKGDLSKPKEFSHEKWDQREDRIYNYFMSRKNSCGIQLFYVNRKDTPIPKDSENRDVQIIYQASLVKNMFARDSRKVIDIIKKLTLGNDAETWIKGLTHSTKIGRAS